MKDFRYLYYLTRVEGLGPVRIKRLLEEFGTAENIFNSGSSDIINIDGFNKKTADSILRFKKEFERLSKGYDGLQKNLEKNEVGVIAYSDNNYPLLLKKIYDPPSFIYYKGNYGDDVSETIGNSVGIVGTRHPSDYGKHIAEKFSYELSEIGVNVISGFARGVDTVCHKAVLGNHKARGITIGVLGCGIDIIYPSENKKMFDQMVEKGLLITEYDFGTEPDGGNFPMRNRIISGMSLGVLVIESGENGGALITARYALDQSREVFALPGYITSKYSAGTNALIKNGQAKLVENIDDILVELEGKIKTSKAGIAKLKEDYSKELKGNEKAIYEVLNNNGAAVNIDDISGKTNLTISDCLVTLLNLEFKNIVKQLPGKRFTLN